MDIGFHTPRSAYRETIRGTATGDGKIMRTVRIPHEYAHVKISLDPLKRGQGFRFQEQVTTRDSIPTRFLAYIESGVLRVAFRGPTGFPLTDICATVCDGSFHEIDSTPGAFEDAAALATADALRRIEPVILEPVLSLTVQVPKVFIGMATADLKQRRGLIKGLIPNDRNVEIAVIVPEGELETYASDLAMITKGAGTYSFCSEGYEELPNSAAIALFCANCQREMILPIIRGKPYSRTCLVCGGRLEPPDLADATGIT